MSATMRTFSAPPSAASTCSGLMPRADSPAIAPAPPSRPRRLMVNLVIFPSPFCLIVVFLVSPFFATGRNIQGSIIPLNLVASMPSIPIARDHPFSPLEGVEAGLDHELSRGGGEGGGGLGAHLPVAAPDG